MTSIFSGAFSTNDEISTSRIACRARDWLLVGAHCRSVRRAGNFREGELQHVERGLVRVDVYVVSKPIRRFKEPLMEWAAAVLLIDVQ
jgi:hypothetical protein